MEKDIESVSTESGSSSLEPLKLTSINDDCKIKVFEYLDWADLLNLSETCKQLHVAVCDVFKRNFGGRKVLIGYSLNQYQIFN